MPGQVTLEPLRVIRKCAQQRHRRLFPPANVLQPFQPFIGALYNPNRGRLRVFCVPVTPTGCLNHAVHSGGKPDDLLEGNVHARLNDLCGDTEYLLCAGFQSGLQCKQGFPTMRLTHCCGQVEAPAGYVPQRIQQKRRFILSIAHHQQTAAVGQYLPDQLRDPVQPILSRVLYDRLFVDLIRISPT